MTDQEIREALKVDPSPEFLARVRTRIASEPAPSAWRWSWGVAGVCATGAMVLIAVVLSRPTQERPSAPDVAQAFPPLRATESGALRRFGRGGAAAARANARLKPPATMTATPAILIDPAETLALRQLIAGVRNGWVDLSAAQRSTTPTPMDLEPVADIVIAPITIDPIAPLSGAEGVRP
jgi:hypothetical protein